MHQQSNLNSVSSKYACMCVLPRLEVFEPVIQVVDAKMDG